MVVPAVVLDSGPVGELCNPHATPKVQKVRAWLGRLRAAGRRVIIPEIVDYESRREFVRLQSWRAVQNLDVLGRTTEYLIVSTAAYRRAADFWARARNQGTPTGPPTDTDVDMILAAQADLLGVPVVVATTNPAHVGLFVKADKWENIPA